METADLDTAVMRQIATDHQLDPSTLHLGDRGAVFYQKDGQLRCVCQKGSHYWNQVQAAVAAARVIARARAYSTDEGIL